MNLTSLIITIVGYICSIIAMIGFSIVHDSILMVCCALAFCILFLYLIITELKQNT